MITFGNLNNSIKTSDETVQTWVDILHACNHSRLALLTSPGVKEYMSRRFEKLGIHPNRLIHIAPTPRGIYLDLYNLIDISLDPFPFCGDNTTCDSLWMGVPVVTLCGATFCSRRGFSHLAAVGLRDLVASNAKEYLDIAVTLAMDRHRLIDLRGSLRSRLIHSPLGDCKRYVDGLEKAYRQAWRHWCDSK
jgi:predicted O-linked N-acetylglucosamine transferase (SPINDLY family)